MDIGTTVCVIGLVCFGLYLLARGLFDWPRFYQACVKSDSTAHWVQTPQRARCVILILGLGLGVILPIAVWGGSSGSTGKPELGGNTGPTGGQVQCSACNGTGHRPCIGCGGTGGSSTTVIAGSGKDSRIEFKRNDCSVCSGRGWTTACDQCRGNGFVQGR